MLMERHLNKKARRASGKNHLKGQRKRTSEDDEHFRARVPVAVSSQFFGWITGIGSGMRIVEPEDVRQQYKEYLQSGIQNYMD
ncbi:hypothetical protein IMM1_18390 [Pseudocoprococcus immobilis]